MDARLHEKLTNWHNAIEKVHDAEEECLTHEAKEKSFFAEIFLRNSEGPIAQRENLAYATKDWKEFALKLHLSRARLNHEKRMLELKQSAFQAEYLEAKLQAEAIQKWPKAVT